MKLLFIFEICLLFRLVIEQAEADSKLRGDPGGVFEFTGTGWAYIDTRNDGSAMTLARKQTPFVVTKIWASTLSASKSVRVQTIFNFD